MDNLVKVVKDNILMKETVLHEMIDSVNAQSTFAIELLKRGVELNHAAGGLIAYYQNFYESMKQLANGKLPNFLIPCSQLSPILREIEDALRGNGQGFRLKSTVCFDYFKNAEFVYVRAGDLLIVSLKIPLVNTGPFDTYKIWFVNNAIPQKDQNTMSLKTKQVGMAIERSREYFFFLTAQELNEINVKPEFYSHRRVMHKMDPKICEVAIFLDRPEEIKQYCEYQVTIGTPEPNIVWLEGNKFLLNQVPYYNLTCGYNSSEIQEGCDACIVEITPKCELITDTMHIFPLWGEITQNKKTAKQYAVNRVLMTHFFDADDLRAIKGDSLGSEPWQVELPKWKIHKSSESDFIAKDEEMKLKLSKAVNAVQNDREIVNSIADSIVIGNQKVADRWDWIEYMCFGMAILIP